MKTYPVVLIQDDGTPKILGVYNKYEDADRAVDKFSDLYPNGYVDVLISQKTMLNISVTEQELNTILHGLYVLEDQSWFKSYELTEPLIKKLNEILPKDNEEITD